MQVFGVGNVKFELHCFLSYGFVIIALALDNGPQSTCLQLCSGRGIRKVLTLELKVSIPYAWGMATIRGEI